MSLFRSLFVTTPLIVVSTAFLWALALVCSFFDRSGNSAHRAARVWGRSLLAASFIRLRVEGLEKLDPRASYVFVCNHSSYMDIPALLTGLPHQFRFFAKKGLYQVPFIGWHLKWAGHLPVDRSNARASLRSMTEGTNLIKRTGLSMLLFPEGGRSPKGLREFVEGAAYIAIKAGVPVVPMALVGMRQLLPMGSIHVRTGLATLRIAEPIPTTDMKAADRAALTLRLRDEVSRLLDGPAA